MLPALAGQGVELSPVQGVAELQAGMVPVGVDAAGELGEPPPGCEYAAGRTDGACRVVILDQPHQAGLNDLRGAGVRAQREGEGPASVLDICPYPQGSSTEPSAGAQTVASEDLMPSEKTEKRRRLGSG